MDLMGIFANDTTLDFIVEIIVRCVLMFLMIITFLRLSGKRGIRQLSIFEIAIILSLGSAAGDPMFMEDIPITHAFVVMAVILILYRSITWSMMKNKQIEKLLEGEPLYIVEEGMMVLQDLNKEKYSHDEFFAEMRQQSVEHLGQVKAALLETDGCVSILLYQAEQVKWGLPIFPKQYQKAQCIEADTVYSCMYCGFTTKQLDNAQQPCSRCQGHNWTKSLNTGHSRQ